MGLYQSELGKQIHLRNKQKREWETMKKNMEKKKMEEARQQALFEKEQQEHDSFELEETENSKSLSSAMLKSARENSDDTLRKAVDLLHNQNGKYKLKKSNIPSFIYILGLLFSGHTITMRRAMKVIVNSSKLQAERDKVSADNQERILAILEDMQEQLLRLASKVDMTRKINIDDYFPIQDDSYVTRFLDKSDGLFPLKREEFENYIYCNVTRSLKLKRPFEANLLSAVFTRQFISSHRWPGPR